MRPNHPINEGYSDLGATVAFDARVFEYILYEINRYPRAEEGGKYIGTIDHKNKNRLLIVDFLPGGPQAKRSAVEFLPDGHFQERMFRAIEKEQSDVEHLGTWHTHHCNGLQHLSNGDVNGYFRTVNKKEYRPALFVASLVTAVPQNPSETGWIRHFLFRRDDDRFYEITDNIDIVQSGLSYGKWTEHGSSAAHLPDEQWFSSPIGRSTLAEDKRFLESAFTKTTSTLRKGQVRTRCEMTRGTVTVTYPAQVGESETTIEVNGPEATLTITCDLKSRKAAFKAAIFAVDAHE